MPRRSRTAPSDDESSSPPTPSSPNAMNQGRLEIWFEGHEDRIKTFLIGGAPKVHEELHVQRKWMKEWRQVGRHLQAMEGEKGDRIS